jgi:DNA-binding response OmpR family regulator
MNQPRVLVVDDEDDVRGLIRMLLTRAGMSVAEASTGMEALRRLQAERVDAIVLDVSMPGLNGWQTLERIRDVSETPVLMLTARTGELNAVRGLRAGADDYVTKPFGRQELVARVSALLRRGAAPAEVEGRYRDGAIEIDFASREVRREGRPVTLTPLEFRLLTTFARHPGQTLSRDQLSELVWGDSASLSGGNHVKLYVGYLRRKLAIEPSPIETVRGFGYRYRPRPLADSHRVGGSGSAESRDDRPLAS